MLFKDLLSKPNARGLISLVNVLSSSGLNQKYSELAILSMQIKRAILPEKEINPNNIENILSLHKNLPSSLQNILDSCCNFLEEDISPNKGSFKKMTSSIGPLSFIFNNYHDIDQNLIEELNKIAVDAKKALDDHTGPGNEFLGWLDLHKDKTEDIITTANNIIKDSDAVVFIGIGGSYLGAKAVMSALLPENYNTFATKEKKPEIYFAGHNLSTNYLTELLKALKGKRTTLIPISKSGTTTEPAVAFRILMDELEKSDDKINVVAITDQRKGSLKKLADSKNWKTFVIPDNVGGRFSVLSPVGLLPIAISGININDLLHGAKIVAEDNSEINSAMTYAIYRQALHLLGKDIEILSCWSPYLTQMTEWWKQLYGESEGKDGKGVFVASTTFTTDLHSVGQLIQDGKRNFFETFLTIKKIDNSLIVNKNKTGSDDISYLVSRSPDYINEKAFEGTCNAHSYGNVPSMTITLENRNEKSLGALLYWWEYACAISAYMQGVNPFNQPGVEEYKNRMFSF